MSKAVSSDTWHGICSSTKQAFSALCVEENISPGRWELPVFANWRSVCLLTQIKVDAVHILQRNELALAFSTCQAYLLPRQRPLVQDGQATGGWSRPHRWLPRPASQRTRSNKQESALVGQTFSRERHRPSIFSYRQGTLFYSVLRSVVCLISLCLLKRA